MKSTSWFVAALCCLVVFSISAPAFAANIAWVTFHPGDNMPSTAAGTAGFTQAPDVGYTQALAAAGHTVTRVVTQDITATAPLPADKLATLAASDLIIIGRSVNSGHYQVAEETLFWNTLAKPIINMGGYSLRGPTNTRLGFYVDDTIPDTTGPTKLTATNPAHPIFAGVSLDGSNTMVNNYADLVTLPYAPNTVQRGISVIVDPLVPGAQLLATTPMTHPTTMSTVEAPMIAYLPPGTMTSTAVPNVLGGHRLIFLSGSREDASPSDKAGIYDLSADGSQMFLNAVNFMLTIPEPNSAILLAFAMAGLGMLRKR